MFQIGNCQQIKAQKAQNSIFLQSNNKITKIANKIVVINKMNEFTNSHLSYDEIITQEDAIDDQEYNRQRRVKLRPQKYKPFWIQRVKNNEKQVNIKKKNNKLMKQQAQSTHNPEEDEQEQVSGYCYESVDDSQYEDDFELMEDPIDENRQQNNKSIKQQIRQTQLPRYKHNYSAILPKINKTQTTNKIYVRTDRSNFIINQSKSLCKVQTPIGKSTTQLRKENIKLVQSIQQIRKYLPTFKLNNKILNEQAHQIYQMKQRYAKFFDIDYEIGLDKSCNNKSSMMIQFEGKIKEQERIISNPFLKNRMSKHKNTRFKLIINQAIQEQKGVGVGVGVVNQFNHTRQHVLFKKREQDINQKRIQQLNAKIKHYSQVLFQLDERAKTGAHQQLTRKKIVMQYDIQMKKTQFQQRECMLMLQIAELNNQSSRIQVQSSKINQQTNKIITELLKSKQVKTNTSPINVGLCSDESLSPPKISRLSKLFTRKR